MPHFEQHMLSENIQTKAVNYWVQFVNTIKSNKVIAFLYAIFFIGVAIKLVLWDRTPYVSIDSVYYLNIINNWAGNEEEVFFDSLRGESNPPLYLFLVKEITKLGISALYSALLINIILGSLIPIIIYYLTVELFDSKRIAAGSSFIALLHPTLNRLSIEAQRDIGYLFFLSLFGVLFIQYIHNAKRTLLVASSGCLLGALFFRIESLELFPVIMILWGIQLAKKRSKRTLVDFAVFLTCSALWFFFFYSLTEMQVHDLNKFYNKYTGKFDDKSQENFDSVNSQPSGNE